MIPGHKSIPCKLCGSNNIVRFGHYRGIQRWWCKDCHHKFADNNAIPKMKTPAKQVSSALNMYFEGMRLTDISRLFLRRYGIYITNTAMYYWVTHFSKTLIQEANRTGITVGDIWIATKTVIRNDIKDTQLSLLDLFDIETRFLLASKLSFSSSQYDIKLLFELATERAGHVPSEILSDGWKGYQHGIELTPSATDQPIKFSTFDSNRYSELLREWYFMLNDRNKILRGLKKKDNMQLLLEGWRVHYNFFKLHQTLNGKTPAEMAKANFKFHDWWEVINNANQNFSKP